MSNRINKLGYYIAFLVPSLSLIFYNQISERGYDPKYIMLSSLIVGYSIAGYGEIIEKLDGLETRLKDIENKK